MVSNYRGRVTLEGGVSPVEVGDSFPRRCRGDVVIVSPQMPLLLSRIHDLSYIIVYSARFEDGYISRTHCITQI
jgi:hypothetical protein